MTDSRTSALEEAREILLERVALGPDRAPLPEDANELAQMADSSDETDYRRLEAALSLALRGDARGVTTLRLVFNRPCFAITNSGYEQGAAALGLALLGDTSMRQRLELAPAINFNRQWIPLALKILGPERRDARASNES